MVNLQCQADWGIAGAGSLRDAALYSAKLSLISAILFAVATVAIVAIAYSSSHFWERNFHLAGCLTVSGIAFMYAPDLLPAML